MKKQPNILFLMCDQLQGRLFHQETPCITPNLDILASQSLNFKNAYATNPVCSPSRASLMTGELPHNHGVNHVTHTKDKDQSVLRTDHPHFAQHLEAAGYRTGYFGKWHVEHSETPQDFGWQVRGADPRSMKRKKVTFSQVKYEEAPHGYKADMVMYGVTTMEAHERPIGIITNAANDFLDEVQDKEAPWCCFVSVPEPHDPYICHEKYYNMYEGVDMTFTPNYKDDLENRPNLYKKATRTWAHLTEVEKKDALRCYYASITEMDNEFGRLLKRVEHDLDNTIIVFTSDHGDAMGAHGIYQKNVGAFEESYNIPMLIHAPDKLQGQVSSARVGIHDVCPTLLDIANCKPIKNVDSTSFASVFDDITIEKRFNKGYAEYEGTRYQFTQRIVYYDQWKYVLNGFDFDELYNLEEDPYEMDNRIDDKNSNEQLNKMVDYLWQRIEETGDKALWNSHYPSLRLAPKGPLKPDSHV